MPIYLKCVQHHHQYSTAYLNIPDFCPHYHVFDWTLCTKQMQFLIPLLFLSIICRSDIDSTQSFSFSSISPDLRTEPLPVSLFDQNASVSSLHFLWPRFWLADETLLFIILTTSGARLHQMCRSSTSDWFQNL